MERCACLADRAWESWFVDSVREELWLKADGVSWVIGSVALPVRVFQIIGRVHLNARIICGKIHENAGRHLAGLAHLAQLIRIADRNTI